MLGFAGAPGGKCYYGNAAHVFMTKMASDHESLENLVTQIVNHRSFHDAVNSASQRLVDTNNSSDDRSETATTSSQNTSNSNTARRTPREEFQALFRRGASFQQSPNLPQFQRRTSWGPSPSSRSRNQGKRTPYDSSSKGKNPTKKTTFAREVVLLRRPSDSVVRGRAKAELQRLGHVLSSFGFDKLWSANEVVEKLKEAFKNPFESSDCILDSRPKYVTLNIFNCVIVRTTSLFIAKACICY